MEQAVALGLTFFLLLGQLFFLNLDVIFVGQPAQGFGVGVVLVVHEEPHGVARFAAAETFEDAFGRRNIERRGLLVVERAAANVVGTPFFQRHKFPYHLLYMGGIHDAVYGIFAYHSGCKDTKKNPFTRQ